jgi:hypothetical protein
MSDNRLKLLVAEEVDRYRPADQPAFEAIEVRWRRRRLIRRSSALAVVAVLAAAAVAVPAALLDRPGGRDPLPPAAADVPSLTQARPIGRIPWEVTGVSACNGTDCHRISDPRQVGLLVDDVNASKPYPFSYHPCGAQPPNLITLTFTGPQEPYPVIEVMAGCDWWTVRGETQRYEGWGLVRQSALQAQRLGVVIHDCGVTSPYIDEPASEFVGLTLDEAQSQAAQRGLTVRVLGQDGHCTRTGPEPAVRQLNRVNLYLEHGRVVTAARF